MKKLFALILALLMLCACGVQEEAVIEESQSKAEITELDESSRILEGCVFKTTDGKYGVQKDGKIVLPATYEEFKKVGELGNKTFYALGFKDGTKPCLEYNEDGTLIGITETERTLYDIFDSDGNMLLSFPVDDFYNEDGKNLHVTLEGTKYFYAFSDEGEIETEDIDERGKDWPNLFGFDAVKYYYDASPFNPYWGLADSEGNVVIPEIYNEFQTYFGNRLVAFTHTGMVGYSAFRLYDSECNLLCEKYSYIEYYQLSDGRYIGIGKCDYPEHQSPLVCRDENGEIMPGGLWFINENGKALSERFDIDAVEIEVLDKTVKILSADGKETVIPAEDYIFEPGKLSNGAVFIGSLAEEDIYALEVSKITKPHRLFNDDGKQYLEKTERTLYKLFDHKGNEIIPHPVESYDLFTFGDMGNEGENHLYCVYDGYLYIYDAEKDFKRVSFVKSGPINKFLNGFEMTWQFWEAFSPYMLGKGLNNPDGSVFLEPIYQNIEAPFSDRFVAEYGIARNAVECTAVDIIDLEGNVLSDCFNMVEYYFLDDGTYIGVGRYYGGELICRDENGNEYEKGNWFIDKDGNKISENFSELWVDYSGYGEDFKLGETVEVVTSEGEKKVLPIETYSLKP